MGLELLRDDLALVTNEHIKKPDVNSDELLRHFKTIDRKLRSLRGGLVGFVRLLGEVDLQLHGATRTLANDHGKRHGDCTVPLTEGLVEPKKPHLKEMSKQLRDDLSVSLGDKDDGDDLNGGLLTV